MDSSASAIQPADSTGIALRQEGHRADTAVPDDTSRKLTGISSHINGELTLYTIENDLIRVTISNQGGKIHSVQLKNYRTWDSLPLHIFRDGQSDINLNFFAGNKIISTSGLFFIPDGNQGVIENDTAKIISLNLQENENRYLKFTYWLSPESYMVNFRIEFAGMDSIIASNTSFIGFNFNLTTPRQEKNLESERMNSTIYYSFTDGESDYLSETSDERITVQNRLKWIGLKQHFFSAILIAGESFDKPTYLETHTPPKEETGYVKKLSAELTIPYDHKPHESFGMKFYFGPNHYQSLKREDLGLEAVLPLGWGIFGWVNKFFIIPVFNFLNEYISNYGLIILLLTVIIKIILILPTYRTYLSSARMKALKPETDALNAKFPKAEDSLKRQQAMMELYKKAGVNPLGGCLPMLLQLPILIAMFRFFPASIELRQQGFLWADDLSSYDSIWDMPFNIPFYGDHVSLWTLLMTASTLLYTWINQKMTPSSPQMEQMKWMMYLMPIFFLGIFNNYSAALSYYYFLVNIISFGQQYLMKFFVNEDELRKKIMERKKQPVKKSFFQQRLEKMAKGRGMKLPK
ncbi:MAG: membrane protein insertase YidC [Bacteroidetes bacterium]|nr:membrane protein insertase YidC [Bacteroidota bacterium]